LKSSFLNLLTSSLADIKADFPDAFNKWNSYLENFDIEQPISELPEVSNNKLKYFLSNRQIFSQYYNIKNAEVRLSKFNILAPFSGTVTMSLVENGTYIRPGQKLGELASTGRFELEVSVPVDDVPFLKIGDNAKITAQTKEGEWNARITRIAKNIDPNTQTVKVFLDIYSQDLKDGMYMKAEIKGDMIANAVKVPRKALVNNEYVFTIEDSTLDRFPIEIIKLTNEDAFLKGIDSNKIIITDAIANAQIGMQVKRINE
jgi:RND family efflux transporter MFP subunit